MHRSRRQVIGNLDRVDVSRLRVANQIIVLQCVLILVNQIVHQPERLLAAVHRNRLGRFCRRLRVRVRFVGSSSGFIHPMHIHGGPFTIVETDGQPVPEAARLVKDTVNVAPGERYDVIWEARRPGKWLLHCHINHHTTNDNREEHGGGGLMLVLEVS